MRRDREALVSLSGTRPSREDRDLATYRKVQECRVGSGGSDMGLQRGLERRRDRSAQAAVATIRVHSSDHPGRQDLRGSHELESR